MFSKKMLTVLLGFAVVIISYQTYSLASLSSQISEAQVGLGSSSAVNFSDSGGAPSMVGGC